MELGFLLGMGMDLWIPAALVAVVAYLLGCFNGAVIVSKYILRNDVRNHGSGNAGLTNFYRTFGGPLTAVVILCDVFKAVLAVSVGVLAAKNLILDEILVITLAKYWGGLFCLIGHMFPCMFHFKGGKGILSGGTIAIMVDWRVALVVWGGFLILAVLTRYVSLGSVWAGGSFPFITWICYPEPAIVVLSFLCGGLVVWMHRANIKRLIQGNENKFTLRKKK